jgi:membrane protein implicated in regulation of membrane protease activity
MSTLIGSTENAQASPRPAGIDPRGPQLAASITAVVLVAILLLPPTAALVLTAVQAALFALGAARGVQRTPHELTQKNKRGTT